LTLLKSNDKRSLKVLMVSPEYPPMPGGVGRYTFNLTKQLQKLGLEVLVVCSDQGNGDFYGLSPNNRENSEVLLKLITKINPDIIHIQFEPGLYGLSFALNPRNSMTYIDSFYKTSKKVPIVTTFHTNYKLSQWLSTTSLIKKQGRIGPLGIPLRFFILFWKYFSNYFVFRSLIIDKLRSSHAGIMLSHYMSNLLGGGNVIYHGAEPSISPRPTPDKARSFFSLPEEKKIALAVGFKTATKGWDVLKKMNLPDNWIIVMNSSKSYYNTENYGIKLKENGLNGNRNTIIDLQKGFLNDESLSMLFYAADVVLLPYKAISASGVMFDALAHGLPFIATDLKFFNEFSEQGLGITTKRKPQAFSNAIKRLENNYSSYIESVNIFKNKLRWEYVAKQHKSVYYSIIEESNRKSVN
jgi:glycosyltransferase involved in cell wall biosynthesis